MERKRSVIQHVLLRILFACFCITLLICSFVLPAGAAVLDYNDYITDVVVDGENDLVTVSFPVAANTHYTLFRKENGSYVAERQGVSSAVNYMLYPGEVYAFQFIPLYTDTISLKDIPNGTRISVDVDFTFDSDRAYNTPHLSNYVRFYDSSGNQIGDELFNYGSQAPAYMFPAQFFLNKPSDSSAFTCTFAIQDFSFATAGDVATSVFIHVKSYSMTMTISSLLRLQQESGRTNKILAAVEQQLADQGQILDDILSGGSGAEDLIAGGDKIENAGSGLGEDIGKIEDFEDQYMGQLEDNLDDVIAGADLTWLYPPLMFVQRYLNKIVAAIPSKYLIVFTLPMCFGLFMYIVGHPVRAPRPDTSGDQVTRETFTETTILSGPNVGRVSSTRTVTTSQEIGRIHNE